jgi:hypothetical protein
MVVFVLVVYIYNHYNNYYTTLQVPENCTGKFASGSLVTSMSRVKVTVHIQERKRKKEKKDSFNTSSLLIILSMRPD